MDKKTAMRISNEKGIALVLSLFLLTAMSLLGASLMFLSQTETYSSMNYRLMSQARYGAESGIQKAANYVLYSYTPPVTGGADPIANYNTNVTPVTCIALRAAIRSTSSWARSACPPRLGFRQVWIRAPVPR